MFKNPAERLSDFYYKTKQKLLNYNDSPRASFRKAQASLELELNEIEFEKQNELICSSYQDFDKAYLVSPLNPDYLLGRAQSEALLLQNKAPCRNFVPSREHIITDINQSLTNAPFQLSTLHKASDILLLIGENAAAFRLFSRFRMDSLSGASVNRARKNGLLKPSLDEINFVR